MIVVLCFSGSIWPYFGRGTLLLLTFSAACLITAFHWHAKISTPKILPGTAWLCSMGKLSYEIYLSHVFIVLLVARVFVWSGTSPYWAFIWYVPAVLGAWFLGWVIARSISTPAANTLLDQLSRLGYCDQFADGGFSSSKRTS